MKAAAGVARSQYGHAPADRDFRATAQVVLNIHRDDDGFCLGCHLHFRHLKPFPCEYYFWAARVIAAFPAPSPTSGPRSQPEGSRPGPALRLVPPPAGSASDDTVVIRLR